MQQNIRKELKNLCLDILKQDDTDTLQPIIDDCQALLQKLLVADYLIKNGEGEEKRERERVENVDRKTESARPEGLVKNTAETSATAKEEEPKTVVQTPTPVQTKPIPNEQKAETPAQQENENLNQIIQVEETVKEISPLQAMPDEAEETPAALGLDDFKPAAANTTTLDNSGSINARFAKGRLAFGLNDRIAFVKNLFGGNMDDFNRVVSQLNTFEDFEEAENFVENMVKPDYDWRQKEEYEMRFKNRVRQRFGLDDLEE